MSDKHHFKYGIFDLSCYGKINHQEIAMQWSEVIDYEEVKNKLERIIKNKKIIHVIITGYDNLGKTTIIRNIFKELKEWSILHEPKFGIKVLDMQRKMPRYLLIDDIDQCSKKELAHIEYFISNGGSEEWGNFKCSIIATTSQIKKLPNSLVDKFLIIELKGYTDDKFKDVALQLLMKRYNKPQELSERIIDKFLEKHEKNMVKLQNLAKMIHDANEIDEIMSSF